MLPDITSTDIFRDFDCELEYFYTRSGTNLAALDANSLECFPIPQGVTMAVDV